MKKNFLLAMVVMLMTAVSSFAQKEYNMVITLSNGTTVTLGHNDIKEITFNDGEVAISGNMVNTIDSLAQVSQNLEAHIKEVEARSMDMSHMLLNRTEELELVHRVLFFLDEKYDKEIKLKTLPRYYEDIDYDVVIMMRNG